METDQSKHPDHGPHLVSIRVNEHGVTVEGPRATGHQIKEAAIAQGVQIDMAFVLSEELKHGHTRVVGDNDVVTLTKDSQFVAVAPDDPS